MPTNLLAYCAGSLRTLGQKIPLHYFSQVQVDVLLPPVEAIHVKRYRVTRKSPTKSHKIYFIKLPFWLQNKVNTNWHATVPLMYIYEIADI